MSQPVQYSLTEGTLQLPGVVQDQSINVLSLVDLRATLVVTRDWKVAADQVDAFLDQQLQKVKRDMKKFSAQPPEEKALGTLRAKQVAMRFENQGVAVEQKLLVAWANDHLLALTFSAAGQFTPQQLEAWQAICRQFIPGEAGA